MSDSIKGEAMEDGVIGLAAVVMTLGIPLGAMYTYYHNRKLRSQERLAAIARGVEIPMEPELSQGARSRRWGILLVTGALGYIATFGFIGRFAAPDAWTAAAFGIIPLAVGIGFFIDWSLIRRDARAAS
jgi:hypothetical protein